VPSFAQLGAKDEFFFASCCSLRAAVYDKIYRKISVERN
jgi:hypothetical protein